MAYEQTRERIFEELDRRIEEKMKLSGNCAQSAFSALQDQFDLQGGGTLKALTAFPGVALRGGTCGAVSGCLAALGLVFGRSELDDDAGFLSALPPAREFCRGFEKEMGSTQCGEILVEELGQTFDLSRRAGFQDYIASGGPERCTGIVRRAVRIAAGLILDAEEPAQDRGVLLTG